MSTPVYNFIQAEIKNVYANRKSYSVYPPCQRRFIWSKSMKQCLVDSILRGLPIPAIMLLMECDDELAGQRWWIVDGQQRIKSIIEFRDDEFETAKEFADETFVLPIEPNRKYSELSPASQTRFDNYPLQFCRVSGVGDIETGMIYRRLQNQNKLTLAEKLYSYDSKTKELAIMLAGHSCWNSLYAGKDERKQLFQLGIHLLLMETKGAFCNQQTPPLKTDGIQLPRYK